MGYHQGTHQFDVWDVTMLTMIRRCQAAKLWHPVIPDFPMSTQLCQKLWTPKHQLQLPNVGNRIETSNYRSQNYNSYSYRSQLVRNSYSHRQSNPITAPIIQINNTPAQVMERNPKSHWCPRISLPAPCHSPFFAQTMGFNRPKIGFNQKTSGETCEQGTLIYNITDLPSGCHSQGIHMTNRILGMKPTILWHFYDDISWDNAMHMISYDRTWHWKRAHGSLGRPRRKLDFAHECKRLSGWCF